MKNKTGKYLKYAFGEIILVVIGILIALQINNWSESRKNRQLSQDFHYRLAEELYSISDRFYSDEERAKQLVSYIQKSVHILNEGYLTPSKKDSLDYTLQNYFQFVRIEGKIKTFQEMESTGNIGLIYNTELKEDTFEFLAYLESISKVYDQMADQVNSTEIIDKHVTIIIKEGTVQSTLVYDFEDLANDKFLINRMSRFGYFWQTKQFFSKTLAEMSKKLGDDYLKQAND